MTVLAIKHGNCTFCGAKDSIITKVDYQDNRVVEIRSKPCYECSSISYKQEQLIEEDDGL